MSIVVVGTGMTKFGELWNESIESLSSAAVTEALREAKCTIADIDLLVVGNMLLPHTEGRSHIGGVVSDAIGYGGPSMHVEAACASGGLAVYTAVSQLKIGKAKRVLVVGVEKMTDVSSAEISRALMGAGGEDEQLYGLTFPSLYALIMQEYMNTYQVQEKDIACAAVLSHKHGSMNPLAQFGNEVSVQKVINSPVVASPIRQLMCSPISDGACAVILERKEEIKHGDVEIIGNGLGGDTLSLARRKKRIEFKATQHAMNEALHESQINKEDVNLIELHDCFSIAHVLALEDMGLVGKGKAPSLLKKDYGSILKKDNPVINTSGGLKACGHPVGATGVKQIVEITRQLWGVCGKRQVKRAHIGLTHNVGGTGTTAVIHILRRKI